MQESHEKNEQIKAEKKSNWMERQNKLPYFVFFFLLLFSLRHFIFCLHQIDWNPSNSKSHKSVKGEKIYGSAVDAKECHISEVHTINDGMFAYSFCFSFTAAFSILPFSAYRFLPYKYKQ